MGAYSAPKREAPRGENEMQFRCLIFVTSPLFSSICARKWCRQLVRQLVRRATDRLRVSVGFDHRQEGASSF